jgi:hypothetical protein
MERSAQLLLSGHDVLPGDGFGGRSSDTGEGVVEEAVQW